MGHRPLPHLRQLLQRRLCSHRSRRQRPLHLTPRCSQPLAVPMTRLYVIWNLLASLTRRLLRVLRLFPSQLKLDVCVLAHIINLGQYLQGRAAHLADSRRDLSSHWVLSAVVFTILCGLSKAECEETFFGLVCEVELHRKIVFATASQWRWSSSTIN